MLADSAPETSRHLMYKYNAVAFDHDVGDLHARRTKVCGACGSIVKSGINGSLKREQKVRKKDVRASREKSTTTATHRSRTLVYTCHTCDRKTRTTAIMPARKRRVKGQGRGDVVNAPEAVPEPVKPPVVLSQTKATATKKSNIAKKSGLAALLAQRKPAPASASSTGMNLMDFMKKK